MLIKSLAAGFVALVLAGCSQAPQKQTDGTAQASPDTEEETSGDYTFAQQRTHVPRRMQRFDANHDGMLTPNEIPPRLRTWFAEVDTNHDNVVTIDEIRAYNRAHPHAHHHDHGGQPQPQPQPQQTTL